MWHETPMEIIEFLKSIVRLDEDQCTRRMVIMYIHYRKPDDKCCELEGK